MREGVSKLSAISALILNKGTFFLADTHVNYDPTPEALCETILLVTDFKRQEGLEPKLAMISHSNSNMVKYMADGVAVSPIL